MFFAVLLFFPQLAFNLDAGYVNFDLPLDTWECSKDRIKIVCQPKAKVDKTQAILILNSKVAGPEDNMDLYAKHLQKPKMLTLKGLSPTPSKVIYTDARMIGPQKWVESLHESSEVPDFYTLYLVTRSGELSILLQLSASKKHQKKFNPTFKRLVESLRLNQQFIAQVTQQIKKSSQTSGENTIFETTEVENTESSSFRPLSGKYLTMLIGLVLILGFGLFVYYKKS